MANCLRAGARHGVPVIVCDRPNPIGGTAVEGPMLLPGFESFVGQFAIPMRHGMTIGELARLFNEHFRIGATLEVRADGRLAPRDVLGRDRAAVDDSLAQHANLGHGDCLPWRRPVRGHHVVGGARDDASRSRSSARRGSTAMRSRLRMNDLGLEGALLSSDGLRADVPQARQAGVRRVPDPRDRPVAIQAGPRGRGAAPGISRCRAAEVRVASAAVRVRARQDADRHPGRFGCAAPANRVEPPARRDRGELEGRE